MMNGPAIWFAYSETHEQNEKGWSLRTKSVSCLSVSTRTKKEGEMTLMSFVVGMSQLQFFFFCDFFSQEFVF